MIKEYILGLDPSIRHTGVVLFYYNKKPHIIYANTINTSHSFSTMKDRFDMYYYILKKLRILIKPYKTKELIVGIEGYAFRAKGYLVQLIELGALLRDFIFSITDAMYEISPTTLKKFVLGKAGGKQKQLIKTTLEDRYGVSFQDDHQADAFGIGMIAYYKYKSS
jgi:Holliday junction resolvasome RuvABC endonuclease subunit